MCNAEVDTLANHAVNDGPCSLYVIAVLKGLHFPTPSFFVQLLSVDSDILSSRMSVGAKSTLLQHAVIVWI